MDLIGFGDGTNHTRYRLQNILARLFRILVKMGNDHISINALALHRMRITYHGTLHHTGMTIDRIFYLGGSDPVATHVQYIIDATGDPEISICILQGAIAREI